MFIIFYFRVTGLKNLKHIKLRFQLQTQIQKIKLHFDVLT